MVPTDECSEVVKYGCVLMCRWWCNLCISVFYSFK